MPHSTEYEEGKSQYYKTGLTNPYKIETEKYDDFERGCLQSYKRNPNVVKDMDDQSKIKEGVDNSIREKERQDREQKALRAKSEYLKASGR